MKSLQKLESIRSFVCYEASFSRQCHMNQWVKNVQKAEEIGTLVSDHVSWRWPMREDCTKSWANRNPCISDQLSWRWPMREECTESWANRNTCLWSIELLWVSHRANWRWPMREECTLYNNNSYIVCKNWLCCSLYCTVYVYTKESVKHSHARYVFLLLSLVFKAAFLLLG